ncbi:MAG TPA: endonuclease [Rubricoccaceae bacterium]|nr:endonuclease [Rubricoccaceae bacterium]
MPVRFVAVLGGLLALAASAHAQTSPPQTLFPGLHGAALRQAVAAAYRPTVLLSLEQSKDTMYAVIDRAHRGGQDGASCLYTDYFVAFDCNPNCDISQDVYNNGSGLSQEHVWPRSKGATGTAERDLHHLFPSRNAVNNARSDLPFGESPDASTSAWYYLDGQQAGMPPEATRDLWSERLGGALFEPREVYKGDVARAVFYFFAMYGPSGTNQADTAFFNAQKDVLLAWHRQDPAEEADRARSDRVARYQRTAASQPGINPFVVDSSLAFRAFFQEGTPTGMEPVASSEAIRLDLAGPNPFRGQTTLALTLSRPAVVRVEVFDALGRRVQVPLAGPLPAGRHPVALRGLARGPFLVRAWADGAAVTRTVTAQ